MISPTMNGHTDESQIEQSENVTINIEQNDLPNDLKAYLVMQLDFTNANEVQYHPIFNYLTLEDLDVSSLPSPSIPTQSQLNDNPHSTVPIHEQRSIISNITESKPSKAGETWFILSTKWLEKWKAYTNYNLESNHQSDRYPEEIDNSSLIEPSNENNISSNSQIKLKSEICEGIDYTFLPETAWKSFFEWYGGGPEISRKSILTDDGENGTQSIIIDLYPETKNDINGIKNKNSQQPITNNQKKIATITTHNCHVCQEPNAKSICSSCKQVYYCGRECQQNHWEYHKQYCKNKKVSIELERNGKTGLHNLGNTCFMNSALQCLSHVFYLQKYFYKGLYKKELNEKNPLGTKGQLAKEFASLIKELWFGRSPYIFPGSFKSAIEKFAPQFSGHSQHDSHEFLSFVIDGLHEDLNRVHDKPYVTTPESNGRPDDVVANEIWNNFLLRNQSIIVDYFSGQFKSTVICPSCRRISVTFDPFNSISVDIPDQNEGLLQISLFREFHNNTWQLPQRLTIRISKQATITNVKDQLSLISNIPAEKFYFSLIEDNMFSSFIPETTPAGFFMDNKNISAYEISLRPTSFLICLIHRWFKSTQSKGGYNQEQFEFCIQPQIITIDPDWSNKKVLGHIWHQVRGYLKLTKEEFQSPEIVNRFICNMKISPCDVKGKSLRFVDITKREQYLGKNLYPPSFPGLFFVPYNDENFIRTMGFSSNRNAILSFDWVGIFNEKVNEKLFGKFECHPSYTLDDKKSNYYTIYDCLEKFSTPEVLDQSNTWYCSECKEHQQATKYMQFWKLPDILVLTIKRFAHLNHVIAKKVDCMIEFPLDELDMTKYCIGPASTATSNTSENKENPQIIEDDERDVNDSSSTNNEKYIYDLFAVSNHFGSVGGGHYTAFGRNWNTDHMESQWYHFDDSTCSPVDASQVVSRAAYILFYRKRKLNK